MASISPFQDSDFCPLSSSSPASDSCGTPPRLSLSPKYSDSDSVSVSVPSSQSHQSSANEQAETADEHIAAEYLPVKTAYSAAAPHSTVSVSVSSPCISFSPAQFARRLTEIRVGLHSHSFDVFSRAIDQYFDLLESLLSYETGSTSLSALFESCLIECILALAPSVLCFPLQDQRMRGLEIIENLLLHPNEQQNANLWFLKGELLFWLPFDPSVAPAADSAAPYSRSLCGSVYATADSVDYSLANPSLGGSTGSDPFSRSSSIIHPEVLTCYNRALELNPFFAAAYASRAIALMTSNPPGELDSMVLAGVAVDHALYLYESGKNRGFDSNASISPLSPSQLARRLQDLERYCVDIASAVVLYRRERSPHYLVTIMIYDPQGNKNQLHRVAAHVKMAQNQLDMVEVDMGRLTLAEMRENTDALFCSCEEDGPASTSVSKDRPISFEAEKLLREKAIPLLKSSAVSATKSLQVELHSESQQFKQMMQSFMQSRPMPPPIVPGSDEYYEFSEQAKNGSRNPKKIKRMTPATAMRDAYESQIKEQRSETKRIRQEKSQLKDQIAFLESLKICVICHSQARDTLFSCLHLVTCRDCAAEVAACPLASCGRPVEHRFSGILFN